MSQIVQPLLFLYWITIFPLTAQNNVGSKSKGEMPPTVDKKELRKLNILEL